MVVIDDHLVLRALVGTLPDEIDSDALATTTTWWWRLALASRREAPAGALSGPFARLDPLARAAVTRTLDGLPEVMVVPDLRRLLPLVADVGHHYGLNLLAAEALALAIHLDAPLRVATDGRLGIAARAAGIDYQVVT
jgi:hypothetical protein